MAISYIFYLVLAVVLLLRKLSTKRPDTSSGQRDGVVLATGDVELRGGDLWFQNCRAQGADVIRVQGRFFLWIELSNPASMTPLLCVTCSVFLPSYVFSSQCT